MQPVFESIEQLVSLLLSLVYMPYLATFMLMAYLLKKPIKSLLEYLIDWSLERITKREHNFTMHAVWVIALIGFCSGALFIYIPEWRPDMKLAVPDDGQIKIVNAYSFRLLFTYMVGTAFYDYIMYYVVNFFKKKQ